MNLSNSKSILLNNSFTSNTQNICNALGCSQTPNTKISLKIGEKAITIFVCENCKVKFET
jgi:hypothetical protein